MAQSRVFIGLLWKHVFIVDQKCSCDKSTHKSKYRLKYEEAKPIREIRQAHQSERLLHLVLLVFKH